VPDKCLENNELEEVLALPAEHPRRRHLEDCPRCRALLASYAEFLDPAEQSGSRPGDARREIREALDSRILGPDRSVEPSGNFFERLSAALWRPALALAAVVVIFLGVQNLFFDGPGELRYRGEAYSGDFVFPVETLEDGSLEFRWQSVDGADEYRLVILGADLLEKETLSAGADTFLVIPAERAETLRQAGPLFWELNAFRSFDRLKGSQARSLP
jgi:hypothetical protein